MDPHNFLVSMPRIYNQLNKARDDINMQAQHKKIQASSLALSMTIKMLVRWIIQSSNLTKRFQLCKAEETPLSREVVLF